jgi:hypothetical protein
MGDQITKRNGEGTINAIRTVWVDTTSTKFAMVTPDDGFRSRLAIRIGPNTTAGGDDYFLVGDKVKYTVLMGPAGECAGAQDLVKFTAGASVN